MANLQIKGIQEDLYAEIKKLAAAENRSVSQQVVFLLREYLAKRESLLSQKSPAQAILALSGSWEDDRTAEEIIDEVKQARRNSARMKEGL